VPDIYDVHDQPMSLAMRAYHLHTQQRDVEAAHCLNAALNLEPTLVGALFLKAIIALAHGEYEDGWPLYELRHFQKEASKWGSRYRSKPMWDGKPTARSVLIWAEQGFGDTMMMLRFIPEVRRRCPNIIIEVPPELARLCKVSGIEVEQIEAGNGERFSGFDLQCSMMSLPFVLGIYVGNIPRRPYLRPPWLTAEKALPLGGPRVGLFWNSGSTSADRATRNVPDEKIAKILGGEFDFISLQPEHNKWVDWSDTAVVINQLDLIVTVDSGIAHLAGAMGKPTWVMLSQNCCWRWMQRREDSPWYPTMRLFRQDHLREWDNVLHAVARALRALGYAAKGETINIGSGNAIGETAVA